MTTESEREILLLKYTRGSNNNANEMCGLADAGRANDVVTLWQCFRLLKIVLSLSAVTWAHHCIQFAITFFLQLEYNWLPLVFFCAAKVRCSKWKIPGECQKKAAAALFSNYEPQPAAPASWALLFPTDVINQPGATCFGSRSRRTQNPAERRKVANLLWWELVSCSQDSVSPYMGRKTEHI